MGLSERLCFQNPDAKTAATMVFLGMRAEIYAVLSFLSTAVRNSLETLGLLPLNENSRQRCIKASRPAAAGSR